MRGLILLLFLVIAIHEISTIPLSPNSPLWHKIKKRDASTATQSQKISETKNNSSQTNPDQQNKNVDESQDKTEDLNSILDEESSMIAEENANPVNEESDSNSERSIDWQLLSGNPSELEQELETRRRRRSIHSKSLSRQHRIRTINRNGNMKKSRSKRDIYYNTAVSPSDLMTAYAYLQSRREPEEEQQPRIALLDDDTNSNGEDLANLANLIYELQRAENDGITEQEDDNNGDDNDNGEDQEILPGDYLELEPNNDLYGRTEVRITPEQLAALEQLLSEQQDELRGDGDDDEDATDLYPKDKRSAYVDADEDENDDENDEQNVEPVDDEEPTYLIPISNIDPSAEYVQIPLSATNYENPYDLYQIDNAPSSIYDEALRRFDEEQLRQRIASLIDDINDQRRPAYRRRR